MTFLCDFNHNRSFRGTICPIFVRFCILALGLLGAGSVQAQLSPGKLSRPHAFLEGIKNCNQCHSLGDRQVQPKCLECHEEISAMQAGGKGLHAGKDYAACNQCHVEHQGEDYDLVFWSAGREGFDHKTTGYDLQGRHAALKCRECHQPKNIQDPQRLRAMDKDLNRTFLGLQTACLTCHQDQHQGQLPTDCAACHGYDSWKKPPSFQHDRSAFPLTGKHQTVDCAKCHKPEVVLAGQKETPRYRPLAHAACVDCHKDHHEGRLGPRCTDCHTTDGWRQVADTKFDHERTRYPLRGKHVQVKCQQCHGEQRKQLAFAACKDCHRDEHEGMRAQRPALLTCEECHAVEGFKPAKYGLERHALSGFPLTGAHQAVSCDRCHRPRGGKSEGRVDLLPAHTSCVSCHDNPHGKGPAILAKTDRQPECTQCHTDASWKSLVPGGFDHATTQFALEGRHAAAACSGCHKPDGTDARRLVFAAAERACRGCHAQVHGAQFDDKWSVPEKGVDCGRCHVTVDWLAEKFDHERDSRFPLRGVHEKTPCAACHLKELTDTGTMIHFKPLPVTCRECHAEDPKLRGEKS